MSWIDTACGNVVSNNKKNDTQNNNNENNEKQNNNDNKCNENNDKEIALEMLMISKSDIMNISAAITEMSNPQLRELLKLQLTTSINEYYNLSDMATNKQWYNAFAAPEQQLQQDAKNTQNLL